MYNNFISHGGFGLLKDFKVMVCLAKNLMVRVEYGTRLEVYDVDSVLAE